MDCCVLVELGCAEEIPQGTRVRGDEIVHWKGVRIERMKDFMCHANEHKNRALGVSV